MGVLCFGSYAKLLQEATASTNEGVIDLIFNGIAVRSSYGTTLGAPDQSKILNSKLDVPLYVQRAADTPAVITAIEDYFRDSVVPVILNGRRPKFLSLLMGLIGGDSNIPTAEKSNFLSMASAAQTDLTRLPAYLSTLCLYAVQQPNNLKKNPLPVQVAASNLISIFDGRLYLNGEEVLLPDVLTPPETHEAHEAVYIAELLRAYAHAQNVPSIAPDAIPPAYQKNFNEQRQHYINAEAVRRRVREVFPPDNDQFGIFKDDIYDGVSAVHAQTAAHGYDRLLKVLTQAANLPKGRSLIETQLAWIGSSQKQGVCHILVNEKRLTWVVP